MIKSVKTQMIVTFIINVLMYILLSVLINHYTDAFLIAVQVILITYLLYVVLVNIGRYISKYVILDFLICAFIQYFLFYFNIPKVTSGFMGLGGGPLGLVFYLAELTGFIVVMLVVNIVKKCISFIA